MEVTILKGRRMAKDRNGSIKRIDGLEITKSDENGNKRKVIYDPESSFFRAACMDGTVHPAYLLPSGNIMIQ